MLDACGAAPLLCVDNAFAIVAMQSHRGMDADAYKGAHRHVDSLWRAVTASITLKGTRAVENELASFFYKPGDGYFACPLVEHNVVLTSPFSTKAAHFSFGVPADEWNGMTLDAIKRLQLKMKETWIEHQDALRFPTADEYWATLQKLTASATRQSLLKRLKGSKYLKGLSGDALLPLKTGKTSLRKKAPEAVCPAFRADGTPIMLGMPDLVKDLRLYRGGHLSKTDDEEHMGVFSRVGDVFRVALTDVETSSMPWLYASDESKHMGSKLGARPSSGQEPG
jgi:hypothetical protein